METNKMNIFKAFSDLPRMDKEDFARYVVNNLAKGSRERLLFHLAADFLELIQYNSDFTRKQIEKLVSLGINLGKEWTLQNLLDCLPLPQDIRARRAIRQAICRTLQQSLFIVN